ncbi:MAG: hypothetical protein M3125_02480 [Gemmatimonadota bacterium]|nr:hypothetical protein [Gemmatimonadota bacterium]
MRAGIYAVVLAILTACAGSTGLARCDTGNTDHVCARLGEPFDVRVGQTAFLADTRLSIRIEGVPEDSRCPRDVQCVWAGNARVALELRDGENTDTASVSSTLEPHAVTRWDYRIELVEVKPVSTEGQPIPQSEYRIRLLVDRGS